MYDYMEIVIGTVITCLAIVLISALVFGVHELVYSSRTEYTCNLYKDNQLKETNIKLKTLNKFNNPSYYKGELIVGYNPESRQTVYCKNN